MDIASLAEAIYDDLNCSLIEMQWLDPDVLAITLACDDWDNLDRRRRFELKCIDPTEVHCSLGAVGTLGFFAEHPLLLEHSGPHSQLFFSSAPNSPGEVYLAAHAAIHSALQGWRDPQQYLSYAPDRFQEMVSGGHGLLARGPAPVIDAVERCVGSMLRVNSLPSHTKSGKHVVLTIDTDFIVCSSVHVSELGS